MTPADNAFRNFPLLATNPKETISLVSVVPMLEPIIMNIPILRVIVPEAIITTAIDVTVELLCNNAVVNNPTKSAINGASATFIISRAVPNPI